jgi:hypothetical protein
MTIDVSVWRKKFFNVSLDGKPEATTPLEANISYIHLSRENSTTIQEAKMQQENCICLP